MTRSPGFGSTARDYAPLSDSVSLRLPYTVKLATNSKSLTHYTKGTQSPSKGSYCLYAHGFRVYFTPLSGVLFAFPSRYWFTIGRSGVFSLGGWSPHVQTGFLVPRPTCSQLSTTHLLSHTGLSPAMARLSRLFCCQMCYLCQALAISLATTFAISVDFFSSSYLDVSVHSVRFVELCIHSTIPLRVGFPIQISRDQCLFASSPKLFAGYHVFRRLSSPRHPPHALSHLTL